MRWYSSIETVHLLPEAVKRAQHFAEKVVVTTDYSDCNQVVLQKIKNDHFISKLGEEAARIVLSKYAKVSLPDYSIYPASQKSWAKDLVANGYGIAVKTQKSSVAKKYTLSWTFQCGEHRKDVILQQPYAWVIFVEYDDLNPHTCRVFPPFQIKELRFGEPLKSYLKGHKKVVYASSLPIIKS